MFFPSFIGRYGINLYMIKLTIKKSQSIQYSNSEETDHGVNQKYLESSGNGSDQDAEKVTDKSDPVRLHRHRWFCISFLYDETDVLPVAPEKEGDGNCRNDTSNYVDWQIQDEWFSWS